MRLLFLIFYLSVRTLAGPQQPLPPGDPPPLPNPGTLVAPIPPAATILTANDAPHPAVTGGSDSSGGAGGAGAPFCECGYTYCSAVLMGMSQPWQKSDLVDAYCRTKNAPCPANAPNTDVLQALYICLCSDPTAKEGNELSLLCGCDKCLVVPPDYRGRCETPCSPGPCGTSSSDDESSGRLLT